MKKSRQLFYDLETITNSRTKIVKEKKMWRNFPLQKKQEGPRILKLECDISISLQNEDQRESYDL